MSDVYLADIKTFPDVFTYNNQPGKKQLLTDEWVNWLVKVDWTSFITLTFKDMIAPDTAIKHFKNLIYSLNVDCFGKKYTRIVGHSYFSYAYAIEYQKRDVLHFHMLTDKPINFRFIHDWWGLRCGYVWTDIINNKLEVVQYLAKYILKNGEVSVYLADGDYSPLIKPFWWSE